MLEKAKKYFIERGLSVIDFPKAAIIHEALGFTILLTFWSCCYIIRPSHKILIPLTKRYPKFSSVSQRVEKNFHKYREKMKINKGVFKNKIVPERVLISLGESIVLRNFLRPITVPFKLYVTWKIILFLKDEPNSKEMVLNKEKIEE